MFSRQHYRKVFMTLIMSGLLSLVFGLLCGNVTFTAAQVWHGLLTSDNSIAHTIILQLRLPRVLNAFIVGSLLALSGCLMQALLRNPLADPYILGISSSASLFYLMSIFMGVSPFFQKLFTLGGACSVIALIALLGFRQHRWQPTRLLLTGVLLAALANAIISFMLTLAPAKQLQSSLFWLMGEINPYSTPWLGLVTLMISFMICYRVAQPLNILSRGDVFAQSLGINTQRLLLWLYLCASAMTAMVVFTAGPIGFVGLIVPHTLRLMGLSDHRILLPNALLAGGTLLCLADTAARVLFAPHAMPVGIFTALLGIPLLLWLLLRETT